MPAGGELVVGVGVGVAFTWTGAGGVGVSEATGAADGGVSGALMCAFGSGGELM